MFKRHIAVTSIVLIAVAAAAVTALLTHHDDDLTLQDIVRGEAEMPALGGLRQERRGVRRDIVHSQDHALRTVLFSDEADIVLIYDKKDASEQLKYPYGYSQESLGYDATGAPTQLLRYFKADSGAYHHKQHQIDLTDVVVARYQVAGHELPEDISTLTPLSQATAHHATALLSPTLQVEAEQVTATIDDSQVFLSSHQASFDGVHLSLYGDARIESPKASVQAQKIILKRSGSSSSFPFETAVISGGAVITLDDGAKLTSQQVDIDFTSGIAVFSPLPGQYVRWQQPTKDGAADTAFLCRQLTAHFDLQMAVGEPSLHIKDVIAEGDILVVQDGAWRATGDVATFKNISSAGALASGTVTLLALHNDRPCTIQTPAGAHLNAARITCDTAQHTVTLSGVVARQGSAMRLENKGDVIIYMSQDGSGSDQLATLTAEGDTTIAMASSDGTREQKLVSHGTIHVDHIGKRATISSPRDPKGRARSQQVHFSDGIAEMHADDLVIDYAVADEHISPSHILAQGGVCVKGHLTDTSQEAMAQYALCDTLEYWPGQQRLLLSSKPGRVAILDRASGVAVSAPAVEMRRDPDTRKAKIKGIGDVRFTLLDRDYQRLKERFNLDVVDP